MLRIPITIFLLSLTASSIAASKRASNHRFMPIVARAVINDGTSYHTGNLTSGIPGLRWQASGYLASGGCTSGVQLINTCYEIAETNDPNGQLIPNGASPRQRVEFLNNRGADGTSWKFTWRSYVASNNTGSSSFFHTMQIFSAGDGAPAYFSNLLTNTLEFTDYQTGETLASVPVTQTLGRPLQHTLYVTYGPGGSVNYVISDASTGASILSYQSGVRNVGTGGTYLKFGSYRATYSGMPGILMWVGDYTEAQM